LTLKHARLYRLRKTRDRATAHDAVFFSVAWALMTAVALIASIIPATQAARSDLVSVLHSE
jgi:ABC-type lipoprotein release transport system permease subunit